MSASASKKRRKEQEEQGISAKDIAVQTMKEHRSRTIRSILSVALVAVLSITAIYFVIKTVNRAINTPDYDTTAAVATIGNETLTVPVYNHFYTSVANQMHQTYSFFFQPGTPLAEQASFFGEGSLEDYMKENAKTTIQNIYNLYIDAKANKYELSEEEKKSIDAAIDVIKKEAENYGFSNVDKYLRHCFGAGCDMDSYREFLTVYTMANGYETKIREEFQPTSEVLNAEYNKDPSAYDLVRFTFATSATESTVVTPEETASNTDQAENTENTADTAEAEAESSTPTETVYTAEAKTAARELAESYLLEMPDSAQTVSYNKSTAESALSTEMAEWLFDANRKQGDVQVFAANEEEKSFYAIRFEERETNDYHLVNANVISITKDAADAEPAEGEKTAKEQYDELTAAVKAGMTDAEFETAVKALGFNASATTLTKDYSVDAIREYVFDASRKAGDLTTVETDNGYYVVRFVSTEEMTYRDTMIKNALLTQKYQSITEANPIEINEELLKHAHTNLTFNGG